MEQCITYSDEGLPSDNIFPSKSITTILSSVRSPNETKVGVMATKSEPSSDLNFILTFPDFPGTRPKS